MEKLKELDFRRLEIYSEALLHYYQLMQETIDTADYVPEKFCKKINRVIFKEFKTLLKQGKHNYRSALRIEKKEAFYSKFTALKSKFKSRFKNEC